MTNTRGFRFTIRDLMWLTAFVAVACMGLANLRQVTAVAEKRGLAISKQAAKIGPPLMGRDSVPAETVTPEGLTER